MDETEQEMLIVTRRTACKEDKACVSRVHMALNVAELIRTLDIALDSPINSYSVKIVAVHIWYGM